MTHSLNGRMVHRRSRRIPFPGSWTTFLLIAVLLLAPAAPVVALLQDTPDERFPASVADILPDTTVAYVTVTLDEQSTQWQTTQVLLDRFDRAQPYVLDMIESYLADQITDLLPDWLDAPSWADLQGTQITIAITDLAPALDRWGGADLARAGVQAAAPEAHSGVVALIQPVDPKATMAVVASIQQQHAAAYGLTINTEYFDGYSLRTAGDETTSQQSVVAGLNQFILVGTAPADLEPVLATARGDQPALATLANHASATANLPGESLMSAWVNGATVYDALATTQYSDWLDAAGPVASARSSTAMVLWADTPGFRFDTWSALDVSASAADLSATPAATPPSTPAAVIEPAAPLTMDARVSSDALYFANGSNLAGNPSLPLLIALYLSGMAPEDAIDSGLTSDEFVDEVFALVADDLGFHPGNDVLQHLTGEYAVSVAVGNLAEVGGLDLLIASVVDDPAAVQDTVATVTDRIGTLLDSVDSLIQPDGDRPYFSIENVISEIDPDNLGPVLPALAMQWGLIDDTLVVGAGDAVDEFLVGPPAPLSSNPNYRAAMDALPGNPTSIVYADITRIIDVVQAYTGSFVGDDSLLDASPACVAFADQASAQAAFDAERDAHRDLDEDFDLLACEDFPFAGATPAATATAVLPGQMTFASVQYVTDDGIAASSSILLIG